MRRQGHEKLQKGHAHAEFWRAYFNSMGANLVQVFDHFRKNYFLENLPLEHLDTYAKHS